jgi:hypothetical protein
LIETCPFLSVDAQGGLQTDAPKGQKTLDVCKSRDYLAEVASLLRGAA